jgi:MFS family permease
VSRLRAAFREELGGRGVVLAFAVAIAMTTAEGTLLLLVPPYLDSYAYPVSLIGLIVALFSAMRLASRLPAGAAYGAARAKRQLVAGLVALAAATGGFAFAGGALVPVLALAIVHGFAFGSLGTLVLAAVIDLTGGRRAGTVMAWYTAALSTGYALGAFAGGALADGLGIPQALLVVSVLPLLAILAALALPEFHGAPQTEPRAPGLRGFLVAAGRIDPRVWLAFTIVLYINLVSDAVDAFFPLFGLSIGMPLAAIGVLKGLKSASATLIRFASLRLLRWIDHHTINLWGVVIMGLATLAVPYAGGIAALGALFVVLGLCRGILRVTSAAMVAEIRHEGRDVGLSAGVYNAGLDLGAMVGPVVGGVVAGAVGIPVMFQVMALGSLAVYFGVALSTAAGRASLRAGLPGARRPGGAAAVAVAADAVRVEER